MSRIWNRTGASPGERPQFRDTNSRILKASKQLRVMTHHKIQTLTDLVAPHPSLVVTLPRRRMLIFFLRITSTNHSPAASSKQLYHQLASEHARPAAPLAD